jgi:hypothetical protein
VRVRECVSALPARAAPAVRGRVEVSRPIRGRGFATPGRAEGPRAGRIRTARLVPTGTSLRTLKRTSRGGYPSGFVRGTSAGGWAAEQTLGGEAGFARPPSTRASGAGGRTAEGGRPPPSRRPRATGAGGRTAEGGEATLPAASYLRGGCPSGFVPGRLRRRMDSASGHGSADRKTRGADRH